MKFGVDREVEDGVGGLIRWAEQFGNSSFVFCFQMSFYWVAQAALKPFSCLSLLNSEITAIPFSRTWKAWPGSPLPNLKISGTFRCSLSQGPVFNVIAS